MIIFQRYRQDANVTQNEVSVRRRYRSPTSPNYSPRVVRILIRLIFRWTDVDS